MGVADLEDNFERETESFMFKAIPAKDANVWVAKSNQPEGNDAGTTAGCVVVKLHPEDRMGEIYSIA